MSAEQQPSLNFEPSAKFGYAAERQTRYTVHKGLLITFEGGEGVGKSTQANRLFQKLQSLGIDVVLAQEPGSSALGNHIRLWVKRNSSTSPLAETLLFEAARAQLLFEVVRPAMDAGRIMILDRFTDSTLAYQGYGRGVEIEKIQRLNEITTAGLVPDLTILLDLDPTVSLKRISIEPSFFDEVNGNNSRRMDDERDLRFEREAPKFHKKVRKGFLKMAKKNQRWSVISADQAGHRIADAILKRVRRLLIEHDIPEEIFKS